MHFMFAWRRVSYPWRMSPNLTSLRRTELAALIAEGMLITLATGQSDQYPAVARGLAARLDETTGDITFLLARSTAWSLLADLASGAALAATLAHPRSHRAIQLKGRQAQETLPEPTDTALVMRQSENVRLALAASGFDDTMLSALTAFDPDDLSAITLTVDTAYDQSPGLHAGRALELSA